MPAQPAKSLSQLHAKDSEYPQNFARQPQQ
jgi:hypothetical protein